MHDLIVPRTNAIISCKTLTKIGPVVSAENRLKDGNCAATRTRLQFDDVVHLLATTRLSFVSLSA